MTKSKPTDMDFERAVYAIFSKHADADLIIGSTLQMEASDYMEVRFCFPEKVIAMHQIRQGVFDAIHRMAQSGQLKTFKTLSLVDCDDTAPIYALIDVNLVRRNKN
jgi:hypothetical protein